MHLRTCGIAYKWVVLKLLEACQLHPGHHRQRHGPQICITTMLTVKGISDFKDSTYL